MKKYLFLLLAAIILFSGCVDQKTVKSGDNISVDYTGKLENGEIFDTSIEKVAKENNILIPHREYEPLQFTVGQKNVIPGFDKGVIGMTEGDSRTLRIPPEEGYGPSNPALVQVSPIIMEIPNTFSRVFLVPLPEFERALGPGHQVGDIVNPPMTDFNLTIVNISDGNVSLSYNLKAGDKFASGLPWNQTVVRVDEDNITLDNEVEVKEVIQFPNAPWNSTVIDVNEENVVLRHNAIPDTEIPDMLGTLRISFNETSIIIDRNHKLAGKTLIFDITLKSIDK